MKSTTGQKYNKPVFKKNQPDDSFKFRALPKPSGDFPYHLTLSEIIPGVSDQQTVFHIVGDTGGIRNPSFQKLVAGEMARQYADAANKYQPQFLYHLGDIVYHFGEAEQYEEQFFRPYQNYPGPIFAIAGNHDSDVNPTSKKAYNSLDAFTMVFCDEIRRPVSFSGSTNWTSMIQPNIYWTLKAPLANIIGMYSNVPKYGIITQDQRNWFIQQLKSANEERKDKALIICLHHAPYSADINHGSSSIMVNFLESIFTETGIKPHIIFSGHVHNYQRFARHYEDGTTVPFIVSGAGGFDELHSVASVTDERFTGDSHLFEGVELVNYCDTKHGFLKIAIEKSNEALTLTGEYYAIPHEAQIDGKPDSALADSFTIKI